MGADGEHRSPVIPGWSAAPDPESRDSGFDASHRPGMTETHSSSRRIAPEALQVRSAQRGRGECRVPNAPAALCAHIGSEYAHRYSQRRHRKHPAFPTQWFYGLLRALPGDHRFVDPVIRATRWRPRELDACFGAPEPHGFTVRNRKRSSHAPSRPPHPAPRTWRSRVAPLVGRDAETVLLIFRCVKKLFW